MYPVGENNLFIVFVFPHPLSLCSPSPHLHMSIIVPPQVDETTYRTTVEHINGLFDEAEGLGCCNVMEGCLACLTGFATHFCFKTHYERVSRCENVLYWSNYGGYVRV